MISIKVEAPLKVLIQDLKNFEKLDKNWIYKCNGNEFTVQKIMVQGEVTKTAGFHNEILIIEDGTGKAKVTRGSHVPGDLSWLKTGVHCSVVGNLVDSGKLPLVTADKIAKIMNSTLLETWPLEVVELRNFFLGKAIPKLPENT